VDENPYKPAAVVLGPIGLGEELGRALFGTPKESKGGEPPASTPAGMVVIIGGLGLLFFAVYMFVKGGGVRLFK